MRCTSSIARGGLHMERPATLHKHYPLTPSHPDTPPNLNTLHTWLERGRVPAWPCPIRHGKHLTLLVLIHAPPLQPPVCIRSSQLAAFPARTPTWDGEVVRQHGHVLGCQDGSHAPASRCLHHRIVWPACSNAASASRDLILRGDGKRRPDSHALVLTAVKVACD